MWAVFGLNVLSFVVLFVLPMEVARFLVLNFGVVPAFISKSVNVEETGLLVPPLLTLGTYTFLHGNWLHLTGNMIVLWVFGDNIEAAVGHGRFLLFYLLCGIAGALTHVVSDVSSMSVLIGASGAIGGIMTAYLILRPWAHVTVLLLGLMTVRLHAFWLIGAWIAWQCFSIYWSSGSDISYWGHIGGMAAGAGLVVLLRRRGVKLFQRHIARSSQA
jgi:membrane associated rhomboid family serine protease